MACLLGGGYPLTPFRGQGVARGLARPVAQSGPSAPPPNHTWKLYYYAGSKPIAMRVLPPGNSAGTLYFLHQDHPSAGILRMPLRAGLGSTSVTTCGNTGGCGAVGYQGVVARQWYHPYGSVRASTGALPTDITFTGQRSDATGLYFYNARYYSAVLGRFVQADTLVPGAGNPQSLNRYAYVFNNPLKYVDPSGHDPCGGPGVHVPDCGVDNSETPPDPVKLTRGNPQKKIKQRPYGGVEVKALFDLMMGATSGWWHSDGNFNLETFVGLMIMHEAAGQAEFATWIAAAIAQQLYVGGNRPPYCPSGTCVNGLFNFLAAYSESVHRLIDSYVRGAISIMKYSGYGGFARLGEAEIQRRLGEAAAWGAQALHPASLIPDRYYAPTDWGNFPNINRALNKAGAQIGTGRNQVLYRSADKVFYVMTALQVNYWNGLIGR